LEVALGFGPGLLFFLSWVVGDGVDFGVGVAFGLGVAFGVGVALGVGAEGAFRTGGAGGAGT
jgi:hypothetical protein